MTATNPEHNYTDRATEGANYQDHKHLSTTAIAKLIRSELRAKFPQKKGFKFRIRTQYFSGGSSIDVDICSVPFKVETDLYQKAKAYDDYTELNAAEANFRGYGSDIELVRHTKVAIDFKELVRRITDQYNFSDCDGGIDYFHVNYRSHVDYGNRQCPLQQGTSEEYSF